MSEHKNEILTQESENHHMYNENSNPIILETINTKFNNLVASKMSNKNVY